MSLFGLLMGDFDDDPTFGSHMNDMMNLFHDPFGMNPFHHHQNAITDGNQRSRNRQNDLQMMPYGFLPMPVFPMGNMFANFHNMAPSGNCHYYSSRSVMTMARGPDGRPEVYQETMSTTTAPGGVKETKKTVSDSRTGLKKMAIGHHIGERAHILEREQNIHSGEQEERQEFINIDEEDAEEFNTEWQSRTRRRIDAADESYDTHYGHRNHGRQLALPDASGSRYSNSSRRTPSLRRSLKLPSTSKSYSPTHAVSSNSADESESASTESTSAASTSVVRNRKRKHTPSTKDCKKSHVESDSDV